MHLLYSQPVLTCTGSVVMIYLPASKQALDTKRSAQPHLAFQILTSEDPQKVI